MSVLDHVIKDARGQTDILMGLVVFGSSILSFVICVVVCVKTGYKATPRTIVVKVKAVT